MKKILIIYPGFPHYRNGVIEELMQDKEVSYYFAGDKNMMGTSIKPYNFRNSERFFNAPSFKIRSFVFHKKLLGYILKNEFDAYIFHASPYWITILIAFVILKIKNKKCYNWTHGLLSNQESIKSKFYLNFYKLFDGLLLYGNTAKENMIKKGFAKDKIKVVYNSLNYKEQIINRAQITQENRIKIRKNIFGINYKLPQLIFIGRLTKQKKLPILIDVIEKLNSKGKKCNLLFVGKGEVQSQLLSLAKEKNIESQIVFYGPSYNELEICDLISSSDCCVSPGEIGLTAIHSLTYGTPVISHNNSNFQMPEFETIIHGVNGMLYQHNNTEDLVNCIVKWLDGNLEREVIANNCYKIIDERFNPYNQKKIINKLVEKV